jgi:hypothetical protein
MRPVMSDATGASLSKVVSPSLNAAQSTQAGCAVHCPQPRAHSPPSATAWMGDDGRGAVRDSGAVVEVVAAAVAGHWRLGSLKRDVRSIAGDGARARARSPPQPYWRVRSQWGVVMAAVAVVAGVVSEVGERPESGPGSNAELEHLPISH